MSNLIKITDQAQKVIQRLLSERGNPKLGLRLGIRGGGCSGLSYNLDFTEMCDGDTVMLMSGFSVFLDRKSVIYLAGVTLDHESGLSGKGFVFENPQATNTCGCGESFSL